MLNYSQATRSPQNQPNSKINYTSSTRLKEKSGFINGDKFSRKSLDCLLKSQDKDHKLRSFVVTDINNKSQRDKLILNS